MSRFPTSFHTDWQWFHLLTNAQPVILDSMPAEFRPLVQVIDNLDRVHRLGLIFEARVGPGRLLVCASDLLSMPDRPEARQLLASLLGYAASARFRPQQQLNLDAVQALLEAMKPAPGVASASSVQSPQYDAAYAADGDEDTRWCASSNAVPQWWRLNFDRPRHLAGLEILWETDRPGYRYQLEGTTDGSAWTLLRDERQNQRRGRHRLEFDAHDLRAIRLKITGLPRDAWASIREVRLLERP